jgi:hypothetical protein
MDQSLAKTRICVKDAVHVLLVFQVDTSLLKDDALSNMDTMDVTRLVSHVDKSPLKLPFHPEIVFSPLIYLHVLCIVSRSILLMLL